MHDIQKKVLQIFLKNPGNEFGTAHLVKEVFPKQYEFVQNCLNNPSKDKDTIKLGKRKKAKLHRKLLYHLNKLENENVLIMSQVKGKGEKYYILNLERKTLSNKDKELQSLIRKYGTGSRDFFKITGLERYKDLGIIKKYDEEQWSNRVNAILLEATQDIHKKIPRFLPCINDVLGINNFEKIIDEKQGSDMLEFLHTIYDQSQDYNKYINLVINIDNIQDKNALAEFLILHCEEKPKNTFLIIQSNIETLENKERLNETVKYLSRKNLRLNFQHTIHQKHPILIGKLGTYNIKDKDWKNYKNTKNDLGLAYSETSLYVDIKRFQEKLGMKKFHEFCKKIAKSFILATSDRRNNSYTYFKPVLDYSKNNPNNFFNHSYNHIKLWNYDANNELMKEIFSQVQYELEKLSVNQETVFKSCGLPIRFKACLSSSFSSFDEEFLSEKQYKKFRIRNINEYDKFEVKERLKTREQFFKIFRLGDRLRIFREKNFKDFDIVKELEKLSTYYFSLLTYDFRNEDRVINLREFIK